MSLPVAGQVYAALKTAIPDLPDADDVRACQIKMEAGGDVLVVCEVFDRDDNGHKQVDAATNKVLTRFVLIRLTEGGTTVVESGGHDERRC